MVVLLKVVEVTYVNVKSLFMLKLGQFQAGIY